MRLAHFKNAMPVQMKLSRNTVSNVIKIRGRHPIFANSPSDVFMPKAAMAQTKHQRDVTANVFANGGAINPRELTATKHAKTIKNGGIS